MGIVWSDRNRASKGGTELMMAGLESRLSPELLDEVQITVSQVIEPPDPTKIRLLWLHDLPEDPANNHLANGGWRQYHRLVFVSHHQMHGFMARFQIPWSKCVVMQNAITPIPWASKPKDGPIRIVYTSTPHRGLNILLAAFTEIAKTRSDVTLEVFSSFKLYGWDDRDTSYENLFQACRDHPQINYHGAVSNDLLRECLQQGHVFAYPSTWPETSCLCLLEAMSADMVCVHSNYGALYETAANWTVMYPYMEAPEAHAGIFHNALNLAIDAARRKRDEQSSQKNYVDLFYSWDTRIPQWEALIRALMSEPRGIPRSDDEFVYRA